MIRLWLGISDAIRMSKMIRTVTLGMRESLLILRELVFCCRPSRGAGTDGITVEQVVVSEQVLF